MKPRKPMPRPTKPMNRMSAKRLAAGGNRHSTFNQRSKPINRVSPKHKERRQVGRKRYDDSRGVYFDEVRGILGEDTSKWPTLRRMTDQYFGTYLMGKFHSQHLYCWKSGDLYPQCHHMFAGFTRGRSHEFCAFAALSREWHEKVNTSELPLGHLLWLKWKKDKGNVDWIRMTLLHGAFLPDLVTDVQLTRMKKLTRAARPAL